MIYIFCTWGIPRMLPMLLNLLPTRPSRQSTSHARGQASGQPSYGSGDFSRTELEMECVKLRTQNQAYEKNDGWQKEQIQRLTTTAEPTTTTTDIAGLVDEMKNIAGNVEANTKPVSQNLAAHPREYVGNQQTAQGWPNKLDTIINNLKKPPKQSKKVKVIKTVGTMVADFVTGYNANLTYTDSGVLESN